jgi:hypothetical protein
VSRRRLFTLSLLLLAGFSPLHGRHWAIRDVFLDSLTAADFQRLSQYFSPRPPSFQHALFRSDPHAADGLYAIVFLNHPSRKLPPDTTFEWEFFRPGRPDVERIRGSIDGPRRRSRELWLGLTGGEFEKLAPRDLLAWRITLHGGGRTLCSRTSFLFEGEIAEEISGESGEKAAEEAGGETGQKTGAGAE